MDSKIIEQGFENSFLFLCSMPFLLQKGNRICFVTLLFLFEKYKQYTYIYAHPILPQKVAF